MKTLIAFVAGLIAAPLLIVIAGMLGWLGSTANGTPPGWEVSLGGRLVDVALEKRSAGLKNPIKPNDSAALAAGRGLFEDNCAGCHGSAQAPSDWGSKGFYPRVPQFWQAGTEVSPEEAFVAIRDGVRYSGMGAWKGMMKEDEMWRVANFVAHIRDFRSQPPPKKPAGQR